jgi:hypothetical protein
MTADAARWPLPEYDENDQPHFLFVITPPYSGSTALSELLNTSHRTMILQDKGEGQWLVPGLCEQDRWSPEKEVDYSSVKAVWLSEYQKVKRMRKNVDVVIEKSPPNMMRIEKLSSQFLDCSFVANSRNPYANCASRLYRHHDADNLPADHRMAILGNLTRSWVMRSLKIEELVSRLSIPLLTYEEFCRKPSSILDALRLPDGVSQTIDTSATVKVKNYPVQPITNQNERQISKLTGKEVEHITNLLTPNTDLLEFFGYQRLH